MSTAETTGGLLPELLAPPSWRKLDFISDLHLQANQPDTFAAWQRYMQASTADAIFILGDLFEVWVGDDALNSGSFEEECAQVVAQKSTQVPTFFMHGNRDFLVGAAAMKACCSALLADPTVLIFNGQRWLLSHGDALCTSDADYMQFRRMVRGQNWQQAFLAKPLLERQLIALSLRQQSQIQQLARHKAGQAFADIDAQAARTLMLDGRAATLIHGHTHQPAEHDLGDGLKRVVLSDWDAQADVPRAQVLRLTHTGLQRVSLF